GNYKTASFGPSLIGVNPGTTGGKDKGSASSVPRNCVVDFDLELIDLLKNLAKRKQSRLQIVQGLFYDAKESLGHIPSRMELRQALSDEDLEYCMKDAKISPFHNYLPFLDSMHLLDEKQQAFMRSPAGKFLHLMETTKMSRVYKLAVLEVLRQSLLKSGTIASSYSPEDVLQAWKTFFSRGTRWSDLDVASRNAFDQITDAAHLKKIREMPVKHLLLSFDGLIKKSGEDMITLDSSLNEYLDSPWFQKQILDILDSRSDEYYASRFEDTVRKSTKEKNSK
ncbi:hypothetical protein, partial [uncultured Allobaculum sp.]